MKFGAGGFGLLRFLMSFKETTIEKMKMIDVLVKIGCCRNAVKVLKYSL